MILLNDDDTKQETITKSKKHKPITSSASGKSTDTRSFESRNTSSLRFKYSPARDTSSKSAKLPISAVLQTMVGRLKDLFVRIIQIAVTHHRNYQQNKADQLALYQLLQLNDYILRDMGLTRSDLTAARQSTEALQELIDKKALERRRKDSPKRASK